VAEANGSGIPLSYFFISTTKAAVRGAKEAMLVKWLTSLKKRGIHPEFILTDKDQSEINAVNSVWPNTKHQLCFWHALRAVKQWLCQNKTTPAFYDPKKVQEDPAFKFIDECFIPKGQYTGLDKVK
jgi:hypothetical protein